MINILPLHCPELIACSYIYDMNTMAQLDLDEELSAYEIRDVEGLEDAKEKGRGSFGAVYEVEVYGLPCIAKCLHDILIGYQKQFPVNKKDTDAIRAKFRDECILHSKLRHPNVVQFLGVYYDLYSGEMALIMERLQWDLGSFVETHKKTPESIKISLLLDASHGLVYLHSRNPPIVHRDFSAGNVLVSNEGRAKIADLGASKILRPTMTSAQLQKQTAHPGAFAYMPPEALKDVPKYDQSFDIFSFGAVALYTAINEFPFVREVPYSEMRAGRIQIAKRNTALKKAENSCLLSLINRCLLDDAQSRPTTKQICLALKHMSSQYPREAGDFSKLFTKTSAKELSASGAEALLEARDQIIRLEGELDNQRMETTTGVRGYVELERELSEMKDRNTALEQQLVEYAGTISDQTKSFRDVEVENVRLAGEIEDYRKQTKRFLEDQKQKEEEIGRLREALSKRGPQSSDQLEVATLQEKLTAWQEEFEKLAPLRDEVEELRELNEHQNEQIQRLASDNEDLTRQIQSVNDDGGKRDSELHWKVNDYDTLMERFIKVHQTRVSLENELQPLREERAKTLRENAHLREGSNPQNYAKLKVEFEGLTAHAKRLEDHLSEKNALLSVHQDKNVEMQTKLDQATDPERLNSIRLRMERYKQERDTSRKQIDELTEQLAIAESGRQDTIEQLREATEQSERCISEFQHKTTEQDQVIDRLRLYEERMHNYREERNKARKHCKELEGQVSSWRDLIHKKHDSEVPAAPSNYDDEYEHSYSPSHRDQLASPQSDYHPQAYSGEQHVHRREYLESPLSEQDRGLALETSKPPQPRKRTTSGSHSSRMKGKVKQDSLFEMVDVKTKDGTTVMNIGKLHGGLSAKTRPKVIVKIGDSFEGGMLMYVGNINDKEMAGIQMDCRLQKPISNTNQDGTYKDGRMYFKCPIGFGLYVPSSKVYLQMDSAYV